MTYWGGARLGRTIVRSGSDTHTHSHEADALLSVGCVAASRDRLLTSGLLFEFGSNPAAVA